MDRKKGIISMCIIVLVMMVVGYFLSRDHIHPSDLASIKAEIVQEYIKLAGSVEEYAKDPIVWFDENGEKREGGVYRYFGTYGDCVVFLKYSGSFEVTAETPWRAYAISKTRDAILPSGYGIIVLNRDPDCKKDDVLPTIRFAAIYNAVIDLNWLTDSQAEQIAQDLEAWAAAGNY